jgi:hypothetical protein
MEVMRVSQRRMGVNNGGRRCFILTKTTVSLKVHGTCAEIAKNISGQADTSGRRDDESVDFTGYFRLSKCRSGLTRNIFMRKNYCQTKKIAVDMYLRQSLLHDPHNKPMRPDAAKRRR